MGISTVQNLVKEKLARPDLGYVNIGYMGDAKGFNFEPRRSSLLTDELVRKKFDARILADFDDADGLSFLVTMNENLSELTNFDSANLMRVLFNTLLMLSDVEISKHLERMFYCFPEMRPPGSFMKLARYQKSDVAKLLRTMDTFHGWEKMLLKNSRMMVRWLDGQMVRGMRDIREEDPVRNHSESKSEVNVLADETEELS